MIRFNFVVITAILLLASFTESTLAQSIDQHKESENIPFKNRAGGYSSNVADTNRVIKNKKELPAIWEKLYPDKKSAPNLPGLDFSLQPAMFTVMPTQRSSDSSIRISDIHLKGEALTIFTTETFPGKRCLTTGALTTHFHFRSYRTKGCYGIIFGRHDL